MVLLLPEWSEKQSGSVTPMMDYSYAMMDYSHEGRSLTGSLPAAIVLVVMLKLGMSERWAWAGAGGTFGSISFFIWGTSVSVASLAILAAPAMVAGALFGKWIYRILENPSKEGVRSLVLTGLGVPFLTGVIDLLLRWVTP